MEAISSMASSVIDCLNFTWDSPKCSETGKMPVLDLQIWVEASEKHEDLRDQIVAGTSCKRGIEGTPQETHGQQGSRQL